MTQLEYYVTHVFPTGFQSIGNAFRIWCDLMTSNYKDYTLLHEDDPFTECKEWFWVSLGEDNVYPKAFLEYLQQMVDDIESGRVKTYPLPADFFDRIDELVGDITVDLNEELKDE